MFSFKSGFNSKRFSLWLQSPKKVQNHSPEHYPVSTYLSKEKLLRGVIWHLFWYIGAKVKNFMRSNHLVTRINLKAYS